MTIYPLTTLRQLALHAQQLDKPYGETPKPDEPVLSALVESLGAVQIDTLQMVQRSHYLVPWSRLGSYDPEDLDRQVFSPQCRLFEGWMHAACILPLRDYRFQTPLHQWFQHGENRYAKWLEEPGNAALVDHVRQRINQEGGLKAGDFEYDGPKRGSWWDWKPAKNALEYLFGSGELMVANRINFQRVYDLSERVLPEWVNQTSITSEERDRQWVEFGAWACGVCRPEQAGDYSHRKRTTSRPIVKDLINEGVLVQIEGRLEDGQTAALVVHRDRLPALEQAADGGLPAKRTTFLSPFDSLFWARRRDQEIWGFQQVLEAYKPKDQRLWGYFCLPILHGERLVGRFDPKLERKAGLLRLKNLILEPGVDPDEKLATDTAQAMLDFMKFHHASDLVIEQSQPQVFGAKIQAAL